MLPASSLISSRNNVPPSAISIFPFLREMAPVNAPFSWPKSSLSNSVSVRAAQLIAISGPSPRGLFRCSARATNSFPVPLSPWIRTVEEVGATRSISSSKPRSLALSPTISYLQFTAPCAHRATNACAHRSLSDFAQPSTVVLPDSPSSGGTKQRGPLTDGLVKRAAHSLQAFFGRGRPEFEARTASATYATQKGRPVVPSAVGTRRALS